MRVEPLEDRRLLAVIAVDSLADGPVNLTDGNTTLRDALSLAADVANPGADEITFAPSLGLDTTPGEIELLAGELLIDSDVTISGPGASQLTIDADADDDGTGESRVFYVDSGVTATLDGLTVTRGYTTSRGGGIRNEGGILTVTASEISDNVGQNGGGIHNSGTLIVENSTILGNSGTEGGAIRNWYGTVTVADSTISGNQVFGLGGGLLNSGGILTIDNSTISDNSSLSDGGGIWNDPGTTTVTNTKIFGNTANVKGGGVFSSAGTVNFANTTFTGNQAYAGGGIYCYASTMTLANSTIATNSASDLGGGIASWVPIALTLTNSIVALNSAPTAPDVSGEVTGIFSLVGNGTNMIGPTDGIDGNQVGTSATPIDPIFVRNPSSGADATWGTADDDHGDLHLLPVSPAIDAGDNALAVAALAPEDFGEILIDHNDVDITALTQTEMQSAKDSLHIGYAHTSHGSQVTDGMTGLVAFANGGGKGLALPADFFAYNDGGTSGALDLDDHYGDMDDVGYYPAWENHTRTYLDDPANADVNVMMWSWCGQVDSKWAAGTLDSEYIDPMAQLELDYPSVHFVYMTGHVDHWDDARNKAANQHIRDYCADNDKILYDFADIESYDPDGAYYEFPHDNCDYYDSVGTKLGNWALAWQGSHPENVDWYSCSSAHSEALNANQKAYAAWAMFAEIAALPDLPSMTDLDGNNRIVDGDLDGSATVDIGAYEFHTLVVTTLDDELDADLTDPNDLSLREALALAANETLHPGANEITFSAALGLDASPGEITLTHGHLLIDSDVTVTGPGASQLTVDADEDDNGIGENRVFFVESGLTATISNLTVSHGRGYSGGGIYADGCDLTLSGVTFVDCLAYYQGGGLYAFNHGTLEIVDSTFDRNEAEVGGALSINSGTLNVSGSTISNNTSEAQGGGVFLYGGTVTISDSFFANNRADGSGGGIWNQTDSLLVERNTFTGNSGSSGGAIYNYDAPATVADCTILGGAPDGRGSGIYQDYGGPLIVTNSIIANHAERGITASHSAEGTVAITNSVIANNRLGGIYSGSTTTTITNSTIAGNSYLRGSGGIRWFTNEGLVTLNNTIVAMNYGGDLEGEVSGSNNVIGTDPGFVQPPGPGADGLWGTADDVAGDLHLRDTSLAVNMGNNLLAVDAASNPLASDLDGDPRIVDTTVDVGAYEYQGVQAPNRETPSAIVTRASDEFDLYDGETTLREAIWYLHAGAAAGQTVTFSPALNGETITLGGFELFVQGSLTIDASTLTSLTIDANTDGEWTTPESRVFHVYSPSEASGSPIELSLVNLTLTGGFAPYGGAVYSQYGSLTVIESEIRDNQTTDHTYGRGGGICAGNGDIAVRDSVLYDNLAHGSGGAIHNGTGSAEIVNSHLTGNWSKSGGGAVSSLGPLAVSDAMLLGNSSDGPGGALVSGDLIVERSTIAANSGSHGGALYTSGSGTTPTIVNSLLTGNQAEVGGAIWVSSGPLNLINSVVAGNTVTNFGGGIWAGGTELLCNSIIAQNTRPTGPDDISSTVEAGYHNLVGSADRSGGLTDGTDGNLVGTSPLLVDVRTYTDIVGHDGIYGTTDDGPLGDYRLLTGSPALDVGSNLYLDETDSDGAGPDVEIDLDGSGVIGDYTITTDLSGGPRVLNAVVDIGAFEGETSTVHELFLEGTENADTISIEISETEYVVTVNGAVTTYDTADYDTIHIDGLGNLGGNDQITILGTDQNETFTLNPGSVDVVGETYELHATNVETITVDAGSGTDSVTMTGSTGSNRLHSHADYATLSDSPATYSYRADGFDTVIVNAPESGRDYAFLYDSPTKDLLIATPTQAVLTRDVDGANEAETTAAGFQRVYVYATPGSEDEATLNGAEDARNRFYSYADYSILTESRRSFYFYARGFDDVTANSPGDSPTYAYLHDSSGPDSFEATPTSATMFRADPWSDTTASGFMRVYAYSTHGDNDTAQLTGSEAGGNLYRGYPTYSTLTDTTRSYYHYARGFRSVTATGSIADTTTDRAYLYDSRGHDTLVASGNSALLRDTAGTTYQNEALYFDSVFARSIDGTANDADDIGDDLAYDLIRTGVW